MNKILILIMGIILFCVGVYVGYRLTKESAYRVQLTKDIDFEKDSISSFMIRGIVRSGSEGVEFVSPYVTEAMNKTIYFPVVIPYEKRESYKRK